MPGARSLCTVTMKLRPVRIDEKPTTNTPASRQHHVLLENSVENGV